MWLVEDNCDALGTKYKGKFSGTFGDVSTLSFYPAHHITMGEGGAVFTNNMRIKRIAESFRDWGRDCYCVGSANLLTEGTCGKRFGRWLEGYYDGVLDHKYLFVNRGYNLKPLDLQGSIGCEQIEKIEFIHNARRKNKEIISKYDLFPY